MKIYIKIFLLFYIVINVLCLTIYADNKTDNGTNKNEKEIKFKKIIEEVTVTGKFPDIRTISKVSVISSKKIEKISPKNIGEVIDQLTGVYVSEGQKGESQINIRGLGSKRIVLMYDGIPVYEPYFGSFNLKSFASNGIKEVKVIKGASSVLYGANSMGGVINVITKRPDKPFFSLNTDFSENSTSYVAGKLGYNFNKFAVFSGFSFDKTDGFSYDDSKVNKLRNLSDYSRKNFNLKLYYYPTVNSEFVFETIYSNCEYGLPPALDYFKTRYWRFKDWNRLQVNIGGFFPFFKRGTIKTKVYYVNHYNVLDNYKSISMEKLKWESTYKNYSMGLSVLGDYPISENNTLKFIFTGSDNNVNMQDDIGEQWEEYKRNIYSLGVEDHFVVSKKFRIIGGFSVDYLKKNNGLTRKTVNPIIGIKYNFSDSFDIGFSISKKSRFPSMRSLYSSRSGNPDLIDEIAKNFELGIHYNKDIYMGLSVFYSVYKNMIQSYRGLDGYKNYQNIGVAEIRGIEVELKKSLGLFEIGINYTYLDTFEKELETPLDYTPKHQANLFFGFDNKSFRFSLWSNLISESQAKIGKKPPFDILIIPSYVLVNSLISKKMGKHSIYLKVINLLNEHYYSEPGFPAQSRKISMGINVNFSQ